jgi:hypothetical protein
MPRLSAAIRAPIWNLQQGTWERAGKLTTYAVFSMS